MSGWPLGARFFVTDERRPKKHPSPYIAWVYKQAVERHRASFTVIAFAIFYAGHGQDNYQIFKSSLAPED